MKDERRLRIAEKIFHQIVMYHVRYLWCYNKVSKSDDSDRSKRGDSNENNGSYYITGDVDVNDKAVTMWSKIKSAF